MDYTKLSKQQLIDMLITKEPQSTPENIYFNCLKKYATKEQEHFIVISLDSNNQVIKTDLITIGLLNSTLIHPREVFRRAIKNNAESIIIAHNHPSGNLQPSNEDIQTTNRIKEASKILGIRLLDHFIISKNNYFSFAENNLIGA